MRKKSSYKPRPIRVDVMSYVKAGFKKVADLTDANFIVRTRNHDALARITKGTATRAEVELVIEMFNVAEALTHLRPALGMDWRDEIHAALNAMRDMARRGHATGRFVFTGPEMQAVNLAADIHDAQLDAVLVEELEKAMDMVKKIKLSGKAERVIEATTT